MIKETLDNRIRNNRNLGSLRYILGSVIGQVQTMHSIITQLDNRVKNMNNDIIKLDVLVSHTLDIPPDEERIARADGKKDARRD